MFPQISWTKFRERMLCEIWIGSQRFKCRLVLLYPKFADRWRTVSSSIELLWFTLLSCNSTKITQNNLKWCRQEFRWLFVLKQHFCFFMLLHFFSRGGTILKINLCIVFLNQCGYLNLHSLLIYRIWSIFAISKFMSRIEGLKNIKLSMLREISFTIFKNDIRVWNITLIISA